MKACRITIRAPVGSLISFHGVYQPVPSAPFPSTIEGILKRLFDGFEGKFAYDFEKQGILRTYDVEVSRRNPAKPGRKLLRYVELYNHPTVNIYVGKKYCEKKMVNSVHLFNPTYPADIVRREVELVRIEEYNGEVRTAGVVLQVAVNNSFVLGYSKFEYLGDYHRREVEKRVAYYVLSNVQKEALEKTNAYVDVERRKAVVFL